MSHHVSAHIATPHASRHGKQTDLRAFSSGMLITLFTVTRSAGMETNSKPMHVHVGSSTAKLLEGCPEFTLQPRGKINIKGKG